MHISNRLLQADRTDTEHVTQGDNSTGDHHHNAGEPSRGGAGIFGNGIEKIDNALRCRDRRSVIHEIIIVFVVAAMKKFSSPPIVIVVKYKTLLQFTQFTFRGLSNFTAT